MKRKKIKPGFTGYVPQEKKKVKTDWQKAMPEVDNRIMYVQK